MAIVSPGTPRMTPMALKFGEPPVYMPAAIAASCRPHGKPAPSVRPKTTTTALTASSRSANEMSTGFASRRTSARFVPNINSGMASPMHT